MKVHIWAGISLKGSTRVCIFEGNTDAETYFKILDGTLPFLRDVFPEGYCRFMQDNNPKHTSRRAEEFFLSHVFTGGKHLQSHQTATFLKTCGMSSKEFLRREVKPQTKDELMQGILRFWDTVDIAKCTLAP